MDEARATPAPHLAFVVPLLDEEALVHEVAAAYLAALRAAAVSATLVLVDNGSSDATGAHVDSLAAAHDDLLALHLSPNQGYGGGILDGLAHALSRSRAGDGAAPAPTLLGWGWGDGQVDPLVIPELVQACLDGAALARVVRTERQDGLQRVVVTRSYHLLLRLLGVALDDVNGCPKVLRREVFEDLAPVHRDWFLDPEVVLGLHARGLPMATVPATMRPRRAGRSKVRWGTLLEFLGNLARWRLAGRGRTASPPGRG